MHLSYMDANNLLHLDNHQSIRKTTILCIQGKAIIDPPRY